MKAYVVSMESGNDEERIGVHDDEGPRDAAEAYAEPLTGSLGFFDHASAAARQP